MENREGKLIACLRIRANAIIVSLSLHIAILLFRNMLFLSSEFKLPESEFAI